MSGVTLSSSVVPRKKPPSGASHSASVHDDLGAGPRARGDVARHPVAVLGGDQGPMSVSGSMPSPTLALGSLAATACTRGSATSPTATATEIAMHRSPAAP